MIQQCPIRSREESSTWEKWPKRYVTQVYSSESFVSVYQNITEVRSHAGKIRQVTASFNKGLSVWVYCVVFLATGVLAAFAKLTSCCGQSNGCKHKVLLVKIWCWERMFSGKCSKSSVTSISPLVLLRFPSSSTKVMNAVTTPFRRRFIGSFR